MKIKKCLVDNIIVYFYGTSDKHMEDFQDQQGALDRELERFIELLNELLPKYHSLLKKDQLDQKELIVQK